MTTIKIGLPKGSLNTIGRGNTHQLFVDAGYDIQGYEPGKESDTKLRIVNDPEIIAFLTRPQSAPVELSRQLLDVAIVGEDWVKEESVNGADIRRIGDLEYGQTRLVIGVPKDASYESLSDFFRSQKNRTTPILCFTEYPNLTRQRFTEDAGYQQVFGNKKPLVQVRGLQDGENRLVQIINSDGVTEGYMAKGADLIVDNTQTGSTLREYGLRELETIMKSSAGLYAGPSCNSAKEGKAREIFDLLVGAVQGRKYFDVKFNVPNDRLDETKAYLSNKGLCSDEPTVTAGNRYSAINILIPRERFPEALRNLRQTYQATAIVRNEVKQFVK
ncbi:ATP phosphoribosyltransferase [Candidatus Woesearchaeota archaeon]|nr:ATP phosphoribosyltransferase [Candidatus Woesearchaeota archaeon]